MERIDRLDFEHVESTLEVLAHCIDGMMRSGCEVSEDAFMGAYRLTQETLKLVREADPEGKGRTELEGTLTPLFRKAKKAARKLDAQEGPKQ